MSKNYYLVLGVTTNASEKDIKSAYRRLAKDLHPDTSGKDSIQFLELQEAYSVLCDPVKRKRYDSRQTFHKITFHGPVEPLVPKNHNIEPLVPEEKTGIRDISLKESFHSYTPSLEEVLDHIGSSFEPVARSKSEPVKSINIKIPLTSMQAFKGGSVRIFVPASTSCHVCRGRGSVGYYSCLRCSGQGYLSGEYPVTINYPQGIRKSYSVEVPLKKLGIQNSYLKVLFYVNDEC